MFISTNIPAADLGYFILQTLAVLAIIALSSFALVKFGGSKFRGNKEPTRMKVVEKLTLEPRRSIYLVEIDGNDVFVGVSEGNINLLLEKPGSQVEELSDDQ